MCCDQNGLCLKKKGDISALHAGTYTAIIRLASQLEGFESTSVMVSMETDRSATVIKQYDGHTVVMKVPAPGDVGSDEGVVDDEVTGDQYITDSTNAQAAEDGVGAD